MKKKQRNIDQSLREHTVPDVVVAAEQGEKKKRHIFAKLMCLIIATCVWLYVMNQESTDYEQSFTQLSVVVDGVTQLHAQSNMSVITGYDNTVDVIVSGKKSDVQALSAEDIRVSVDVSELSEAGRFTVPVDIQLPEGFVAINAAQLTAEVYVDVNTEREIPVQIHNLDYVVSSSFAMGQPILSHETVIVKGPAQVLDLVDCAALDFKLGNVTTSVTMVGTPRLVDADGIPVSNPYVRCDVSEITVNIPVTTTKELALVPSYLLPELKNGWTAEITPATILVSGDPMLLSGLSEISVFEIRVNAVEGTYTVGVDAIKLPEGVVVEDLPETLSVHLHRIYG